MNKSKTISYTAVMAALCFLATFIIKIPVFQGYIHLGDAFTLLSGIVLGPFYGALAAGLGALFADVLAGYTEYAIASFVIKAAFAFIAGTLFYKLKSLDTRINVLISGIAGGVIVPAGYFFFEYFVLKVGKAAFLGVPFNAFQAGVGIIIAEFVVRYAGNKFINKTYNKR
ncbi:MAG: ECF transporter S component [Lachnospiraceae bacterium]|nr:ECF transporter S component [Lachnospiraceae bacterium]